MVAEIQSYCFFSIVLISLVPCLMKNRIVLLNSSSKSSFGWCSFASFNVTRSSLSQDIDLDDYSLLVKSGQAQFNLFAYFDSNNECIAEKV
jgi:hypothetical protein